MLNQFLQQLVEDINKMPKKDFENKYYYKKIKIDTTNKTNLLLGYNPYLFNSNEIYIGEIETGKIGLIYKGDKGHKNVWNINRNKKLYELFDINKYSSWYVAINDNIIEGFYSKQQLEFEF